MTRTISDYATAHNLDISAALEHAEQVGHIICKHADPIEDAREGLTADEAADIAREDASLIYLRA